MIAEAQREELRSGGEGTSAGAGGPSPSPSPSGAASPFNSRFVLKTCLYLVFVNVYDEGRMNMKEDYILSSSHPLLFP